MTERRLWIVDSDDIGTMSDGVLYETQPIGSFLRPDATSRYLLVATKGYGKTLLLRAKRDRLDRDRESCHLMPENQLTDKPMGDVQVFSVKDVDRINADATFWPTTWRLAITIAVMKFAKKKSPDLVTIDEDDFKCVELGHIFVNEHLKTITDHFPLILAMTPNQHHKARKDFSTIMAPVFRNLHVPIATFVDNVDQYFDIHLGAGPDRGMGAGALHKDFWYAAQIGLASAIRDLHGHNKHIKIFASIRREAFQKLLNEEQMAQQFHGSSVSLTYGPEDLKKIFEQNLAEEPPANLVQDAGSSYERFFGKDNCFMWHPHVGEQEHIWDYLLRHTLMRPRDLMSVGAELSSIAPELRTHDRIRQAVNDCATTIARSYLNEITPHLLHQIDFPTLFRLIPANLLNPEQIEEISLAYNREVHGCEIGPDSPEFVHVFCSLHAAGLLGFLTTKLGTKDNVQRFEQPGDMRFAASDTLPTSDRYIIHPTLDEIIRLASDSYGESFDTLNIAGAGRPWRDERNRKGVIRADVVGFTRIMGDAAQSITFGSDFDQMVRRHCKRLDHYEIANGDSLTLVDRNVVRLRQAIIDVARALRESAYKATLRAGADFGVIVDCRGEDHRPNGLVGMSLRTAARLEELAEPDTLAVTAEFVEAAGDIDRSSSFLNVDDLKSFENVPCDNGSRNICKSADDPDLWKEVFHLRLDESAGAEIVVKPIKKKRKTRATGRK
jgi:class 3 adenylate cyclase